MTRATGGRTRTGRGPRYQKLAITVPAAQARAIKRAVAEGSAESVSAFLSAAVAEKLAQDALDEVVAEMKREFGEPEADLYSEVEAALAAQRKARSSHRRRP
jgi:hypothetical protein